MGIDSFAVEYAKGGSPEAAETPIAKPFDRADLQPE